MTTLTLSTIRQRVARNFGNWYRSFSTTSAGESDGSTLVSTELCDLKDDAVRNWWVKTTSGATQQTRRIEHLSNSNGQVKVHTAFSAQIGNGVSCELYAVEPSMIDFWINETIRRAYPDLKRALELCDLVSGSCVANGGFEDWNSAVTLPTFWTKSGSVTLARNSTSPYVFRGNYSAKLSTATGYIYISSDNWQELLRLEDGTHSFYVRCLSAVASSAYIEIYTKTEGGTTATSTKVYHSGGGEFELLEAEDISIPDDLAEIQIRVGIANATDTAYFDECWSSGDTNRYAMPASLRDIAQIRECNDADEKVVADSEYKLTRSWDITENAGTEYLIIHDTNTEKHLKILGWGVFTELSADSDTVIVPPTWEEIIVIGTVAHMLIAYGTTISKQDAEVTLKMAEAYLKRFENKKAEQSIIIAPYSNPRDMEI